MTSLATPLAKDCINLCHGEASVVLQALSNNFDFPVISFEKNRYVAQNEYCNIPTTNTDTFNYPHPSGYQPLVKFLEEKHQAPVIITNGAKQALGAIFYALKKLGHSTLGHMEPVWGLIKPLAEASGLTCNSYNEFDCFLSIMPNNPDGRSFDADYGKRFTEQYRELKIPLIHDAAYYTPVYLPDEYEYTDIGEAQIYSVSKMFGLSSLRLGYIVFHDIKYYELVQEYIEMMTVGVSVISQIYLLELLKEIKLHPMKERRFIVEARDALYRAKFVARTIRKDILEVPANIENTTGMFLWGKLLKKSALEKANILASYGKCAYSGSEHVRLNLAVPLDKLICAIDRLNNTRVVGM